jgi:hypothetical protein
MGSFAYTVRTLSVVQTGTTGDEVFESCFLVSPSEIIRAPTIRMGFLAMTGVILSDYQIEDICQSY